MTSSRYAGFAAALARVFLRRPRHVPDQVFGIWRAVWLALLILTAVLPVTLFVVGGYRCTPVSPAGSSAWSAVSWCSASRWRCSGCCPGALTRSFLTTGFVNVARYFDPAPGSHAARRAIRAGLVDLLSTLQGATRASSWWATVWRGYIAYDALMTPWAETHELHAEPAGGLESLAGLEAAADRLRSEPTARDALTDFRAHQFALWQDLRTGKPWRTTDFRHRRHADGAGRPVHRLAPGAGGPAGSDIRHELFDRLTRRGVVVSCPPRSEALPVDAEGAPVRYGAGATLARTPCSPSPAGPTCGFRCAAAARAVTGSGGELAGLFGPGVRDIILTGNRPMVCPRAAQTQYFRHPEQDGEGDVAFHLREALALADHRGLDASVAAPEPDPATVGRVVYRSWQRSM